MKRKISEQLKNWRTSKDRKCLIVQGARQVGKTYSIERFAEENYEEVIEINFKEIPSAADIILGISLFQIFYQKRLKAQAPMIFP